MVIELKKLVKKFVKKACTFTRRDKIFEPVIDSRLAYIGFYYWVCRNVDSLNDIPEHTRTDVLRMIISVSKGHDVYIVSDDNTDYLVGLNIVVNEVDLAGTRFTQHITNVIPEKSSTSAHINT